MPDIKENIISYREKRLERLAEKTDFSYIDITAEQENQIFESIFNMPVDSQNLLLFRNYYDHTFDEIEDITGIENAKGEYLNLICVLSETLDLYDTVISNQSIKKVCAKIAEKMNTEIMIK